MAAAMRVLVVDDEEMVRANLCAFLEDEGFAVLSAASGEEALELLESQQADTGIVDARLPGLDGNDFIVRAHTLCPNLKFLIHTGSRSYYLTPELAALGLRQEDVFYKPVFDMGSMVRALRQKLQE